MNPAPQISPDGQRLTICLPLTIRRRGGRKMVVVPEGASPSAFAAARPRTDTSLVKAIARAYRWQRLIETGAYATLRELAAAEKISPSYISRLLRLTLLAPPTIEAALDGRFTDKTALELTTQEPELLWMEQVRTA